MVERITANYWLYNVYVKFTHCKAMLGTVHPACSDIVIKTMLVFLIRYIVLYGIMYNDEWGDHDHVVGFTTTCAIDAYHH